MSAVLNVRGLRKVFPPARRDASDTVALDGVDMDVPRGAFASVLGASGSGKTTLLRCIAGFERPDTGTITISDRMLVGPGTFVRPFERGVGIVPQEGALFPHLTAAQNVGFGLNGYGRRVRRRRIDDLLGLVGLSGLGDRRPDQLSGGQQQRVALARALAPEPALILLDEPFSALDARLRVELREEVRDLLSGLGSTVVLVTHDQGEAMSLADHLVVMRAGRVIEAGTPRAVYDQPADVELGRFLGDALVVDGTVSRCADAVAVDCALGELPVGNWHGREGRCQVLIRPEQISIAAGTDRAGTGRAGAVVGRVAAQSYFGHDALVRVAVPGVRQLIAVRVPGRQPYRPGDHAVLTVTEPVSTYPEPPARPPAD